MKGLKMIDRMTFPLLFLALFVLGCEKPNKPDPPDDDNVPVGTINFSVIQFGDTLGKLAVDETRHNIVFNRTLHVDSLKFDYLSFDLKKLTATNLSGVDTQIFVFLQSINPNIDYSDFGIINTNEYSTKSKDFYTDLKDSAIFYVEAFFCFIDLDTNNTGQINLILKQWSDKTPKYNIYDTLTLDASLHTVCIDTAAFLHNLNIRAQLDDMLTYAKKGRYVTRDSDLFVLTKYTGFDFYLYHSFIYWQEFPSSIIIWPKNTPMDIFIFWPIIPTKYENKFWKQNYSTY